jgi:hypothetical protein
MVEAPLTKICRASKQSSGNEKHPLLTGTIHVHNAPSVSIRFISASSARSSAVMACSFPPGVVMQTPASPTFGAMASRTSLTRH